MAKKKTPEIPEHKPIPVLPGQMSIMDIIK